MGPALETFLSVFIPVLLVIGVIGFATKPFWNRIARYFQQWIEHDRILEEQQRAERECRLKAQAEVEEYCHDDILAGKVPVSSVSSSQTGLPTDTASNTIGAVNTIRNSSLDTGNVPETTVITRTVTLVCNENGIESRTVGENPTEKPQMVGRSGPTL